MPAQWTGELIGEMHMNGITAKQLSAEAGMNPKYVSTVLNGHVDSKFAKGKLLAAMARLKEEKENPVGKEGSVTE